MCQGLYQVIISQRGTSGVLVPRGFECLIQIQIAFMWYSSRGSSGLHEVFSRSDSLLVFIGLSPPILVRNRNFLIFQFFFLPLCFLKLMAPALVNLY